MIIPCDKRSLCLDDSNPFQNLSAEAPDANLFFGYYSGPGNFLPRPGGNWDPNGVNPTGPAVCADLTQELADLCAQRQPDIGIPPTNPPQSPTDTPIFFNRIQSCTVICPDGSPFTFQVAAGLFVNTSQIQADRAAASYACILANRNKVCLGSFNPNACLSTAYTSTITVTGIGPFTFAVTAGAIPTGLTFTSSGNTATISGTPTVAGNFTFSVRASSAAGNFMVKNYTISVIGFTSGPLPGFSTGSPFTFSFTAAGGTSPYTFTQSSGTLPTGLTLASNGLLSGTPTSSGSFTFGVRVTDSAGKSCVSSFTTSSGSAKSGYQICQWDTVVLPAIAAAFAGSPASSAPAWDGIFDLTTTGILGTMKYFIAQSIAGKSVSADESGPLYPAGNWQDNQCFTTIFFDGFGTWSLIFLDTACGATVWQGNLASADPNNPSGTYTRVGGAAGTPATIDVTVANCCPDVGAPVPANFGAVPARVQVTNVSAFRTAVGPCALCNPFAAPEWDGTMPVKCTTGPANLVYYLAGADCAGVLPTTPGRSFAGKKVQPDAPPIITPEISLQFVSGSRWRFQIGCIGGATQIMWGGSKFVGDTPQGTYIRDGGAFGGIADGPSCIHIESY